jgi:hypothetical protein
MASQLPFARFANSAASSHSRWKDRGMRVASAALALMMALPIAAMAADAGKVLAAQRERIETADYRVSGRLVRIDASGARTSSPITIKAHWFAGVLRVLFEVTSPADARVHILLEMRPKGRNVIQIAHPGDAAPIILPFVRWSEGPLGSGFSYEDLLESEYFWTEQTALEKAKYGARDCDVVKSTAGATEKSHYTEIKSWLDAGIGFPVYVEKTQKDGTVKEFTYIGLRQNEGVWSASQVEAKTRGRAGSMLLMIDRGSAKAKLGAKDFSLTEVMHF